MTSRNMTEVFILMRNNAIQNRNMYDERVSISKCEKHSFQTVWYDQLTVLVSVFSGPVTVRNYCSVHCMMPRKDLSYKTSTGHRRVGSINSKRHNTQFRSEFVVSLRCNRCGFVEIKFRCSFPQNKAKVRWIGIVARQTPVTSITWRSLWRGRTYRRS